MKSGLPNSSQFSPVQTPLPELLAVVKANQPDRNAATHAILHTFFPDRVGKTSSAWQLADNTVLAMSNYGLVDKPEDTSYLALTELGEILYELANNEDLGSLYGEFAKHILLNLRGLDVVQCVDDIWTGGNSPTKQLIVKELSHRGIYHPPNGTHANGMRQWLEQAKVFDGWKINKIRLDELLGLSDETLEILGGLTKEQREFAKAFAQMNVQEALSNKVAQYTTALYGTEFPEGGLPQSVLFALRDAGLIECKKTTAGQGAKPYIVYPTEQLKNELIGPILDSIEKSVGLQYRKLIRMPYQDILIGLQSESKHEKGIALEALAFYLARILGLSFVQWRLRSAKTGGAELDVVMESDRLIFSRWQIQCKNSAKATLEDIAKEVGLAQVIKANVVLVVCTGKIGSAAVSFAKQVMKETNLYVALINGKQLRQIIISPAEIVNILNEQARGAMTLKQEQVKLES
jgi:hypothetical protein